MLVRKQYKYKINHNNSDTHLVLELLAFFLYYGTSWL